MGAASRANERITMSRLYEERDKLKRENSRLEARVNEWTLHAEFVERQNGTLKRSLVLLEQTISEQQETLALQEKRLGRTFRTVMVS